MSRNREVAITQGAQKSVRARLRIFGLPLLLMVIQAIATVIVMEGTSITFSFESSSPEIIAFWGSLSLLCAIVVGFLIHDLERGLNRLFPKETPKEMGMGTLLFSFAAAGVSMAFFIVLLMNVGAIASRLKYVTLVTLILLMTVTISVEVLQVAFALSLSLSENVTQVIGGNLTVVLIGVLVMSMGFALPAALAALQPCSAAQYSSMAGALVSSGLTLIAIGLQLYYGKRLITTLPT